MCCGTCCLCKTCCCGRDLGDGAFSWAILDIVFHIFMFPIPLLVSEMVFFSPGFNMWILLLIFADLILMFGQKSGRPAFLTFWLVVFGANIFLLVLLWVAFGFTVYLVISLNIILDLMFDHLFSADWRGPWFAVPDTGKGFWRYHEPFLVVVLCRHIIVLHGSGTILSCIFLDGGVEPT